MDTLGRHLVVEYVGCDPDALNDLARIQKLMETAAAAAKMTIVASLFHPFSPQGVTGVLVLEESHLSIHTWPELGYAAVDSYTCGSGEPNKAHDVLVAGLGARDFQILEIVRGLCPQGFGCSMQLRARSSWNATSSGANVWA